MSTKTPDNAESEDSDGAWQRVFLESEPTLRAFLRRRLAQEADVEDCLQTIFIKTVQQRDEVPRIARRAWLFRVAANESARHWRDQSTTKRILEKQATSLPHAPAPNHLEHLVADETAQQLGQAIKNLPTNWQQIIRLRINENLTFQQIADHLEIPLGTALTHMRRALQRLRGEIDKGEIEKNDSEMSDCVQRDTVQRDRKKGKQP
ncbi:ECF RNA polymerase sigma-E factor [Novipirellula galeiformis]|uniref:ECF RNA polymerase sigma-E factor n=1 Tax=Novipirellula galeiformis TaxID=2528004 RepID=A0A5C6CP64_9BACT|nr:sigma-70 family RNA polymerase sigma factor [Novipirellula galeiformis]TWU26330.1 ECF RNA polymerase sigma-E factor [Novipirellula galeiformis]